MKLHEKHGFNPTIPTCFICGERKEELVILGAAYRGKAPMSMILNKVPCRQCKEWMEKGVILISVRDGETGDNPYRTGGWAVVAEEWLRWCMHPGPLLDCLLEVRVGFMEDKIWDIMGLPRGGGVSLTGKGENDECQ